MQNIYWGEPLWRVEDIPSATVHREYSSFDPGEMMDTEEYSGWGGRRYYEPAPEDHACRRESGSGFLKYASHRIQQDDLVYCQLKDVRDDLEVTLHYKAYPRVRKH